MPASQGAESATAPGRRRIGAWSITRGALVAVLAALAFLPIVNWIPGGRTADWYGTVLDLWQAGTVIVVLLSVILALTLKRYGAYLDPIGARLAALGPVPAFVPAVLLVLGAFAVYALDSTVILSRRPLLIDEMIQLYQARIFEQGRLWLPSIGHPELFASTGIIDQTGRVYGQFPPGGPAFLAAGDIFGAAWLVGPVCGAVSVLAFLAFLRTTERSRAVRWAAAALFAFAPFTVFMSGSHMNHVFTLTAILVATAALARAVTAPTPRPWWALLSGLGYGVAATIRPTDALAFALPAGIWYLVRAARDRRRAGELVAAGAGVALPVLLMLWFNARTTGAPLLFGYELLWGKAQNLGFHEAPWGPAHTPLRGLELVNLYLLRLQTYLFESPVPSLVPALAALALVPALTAFDRLLLSSSGLLLLLYFAYWHDGFFLGPRFVYPLAPVLALWTVRLPGLVRSRFGRGFTYRFVLAAFAVSAVMALAWQVPWRARQYRDGLVTMRWNADSAATATGVRAALVLVRESWGAQLFARMWGLGLTRSETEWVYPRVDACRLDNAVTDAERTGVRGRAALATLTPLLRDSSQVVRSPFSLDDSERYLPGTPYEGRCATRLAEDSAGFTLYMPLLLARRGGNVYARDLHALDTAAVALYPSRPIFLLKPATDALGSPPEFHRLSRDSLARAWGVPLSVFDRKAAPVSP